MTNPFKEPVFKASLRTLGVALIAVTPVVYGFYYDTNKTLEINSEKIDSIESDLKEIKEEIVEGELMNGTSKMEREALKEKVEDIDDKLDMMLKMMGEYMIDNRYDRNNQN